MSRPDRLARAGWWTVASYGLLLIGCVRVFEGMDDIAFVDKPPPTRVQCWLLAAWIVLMFWTACRGVWGARGFGRVLAMPVLLISAYLLAIELWVICNWVRDSFRW